MYLEAWTVVLLCHQATPVSSAVRYNAGIQISFGFQNARPESVPLNRRLVVRAVSQTGASDGRLVNEVALFFGS